MSKKLVIPSCNREIFLLLLLFYFLVIIGVRVCTSDAYVCTSVYVCALLLLIIVDSGRWLYLIVTFIKVKVIVTVTSLRAKIRINTIFPLSKKITLQLKKLFSWYRMLQT
jgi:hypothetical protein